MSVQLRDVQQKPSPVIPVQVKDAQHQLFKGSVLSAFPVQMKDVQPQPAKEPLSLGKGAPPAVSLPATTRPPVKIEAPVQVKAASQVVATEVPCPAAAAAASTVAAERATSADLLPASLSTAADADNGEVDVAEAEALEDIIKHLEIK
jgi:hypothetical protein